MKKNYAAKIVASVCALAIAFACVSQVGAVDQDPNRVDRRPVSIPYDIGVKPAKVGDPLVRPTPDKVDEDQNPAVAPKGKAETLVVLTATWCIPCQGLKTQYAALTAQGYDVQIFDVDKDADALAEKYSNIKKRSNPKKINEWHVVPTVFYVRDGMIIKREQGVNEIKTAVHIKKVLWKPNKPTTGPVISKINEVRGNLPWNK